MVVAAATGARVTTTPASASARARPRTTVASSTPGQSSSVSSDGTAKPRFSQILIIGDSIADSLIDDFTAVIPAGTALIDDAYAGCDGAENASDLNRKSGPGCDAWRTRWADLFPPEHPTTMALWFSGNVVPIARAGGNNEPGHVGEPAFDTWWSDTIKERIDILRSHDIEVVLVLPHWQDDTLEVSWFFGERDFAKLTSRIARIRELLTAVAAEKEVAVVDLAAIVCPDGLGHCRTDGDDGQVLRPDGHHYSEYVDTQPSDTKPRASWVARAVLDAAYEELGVSQIGD